MTILTKWHKLLEAVKANRIGVGSDRSSPISRLLSHEWYDDVHACTPVPKFVIDSHLYDVLEPKLISESMEAMIKCDVVRLPFDPMMIECTFHDVLPDEHFFLYINGENMRLFSLVDDLAVVHPIKAEISHCITEDGKAGMNVQTHWAYFPQNAIRAFEIQEAYDKMAHWVARVIQRLASLAYVITNIQGVEREVIESERLNKQRVKSDKPPVPTYTLLRIGHAYKQSGEVIKYDRSASTGLRQVHMRRGHTRNQRFGAGLTETKLIYIEPVLVNYHGGEAPQIKVKW